MLIPVLALSLASGAQPPIACNLGALSRAERARHLELIAMLKANVAELRELPDGYAFRYAGERMRELGEWTILEAKCCPFLLFDLELQPGGDAWLKLRGKSEVKEFIAAEFDPLIRLAVARPGHP
jgi:hypothetical protein